MNFGEALEEVKKGVTVCRKGWNGKGMYIYLNAGSIDASPNRYKRISGVPSYLFGRGDKGTVTRMPNINMRAADGATVTGWLASQTDMLAEDWEIVA